MDNFDPKPYCEEWINIVKEHYGKDFTYKKEDIEELDEILERFHEEYERSGLSDTAMSNISVWAGCYIGQVMLETKLYESGYKWSLEENEPCLEKNDGNKCFPCTKVWKRIANGREDSVKSFFDIGLLIAEGKIPQMKKDNG